MALPTNAKYFADLNAASTEDDTHLLALQQGTPPAGGASPTPTRKWSLLSLRTWLQNHFVRGPATAVTADRLALFDGTSGRLLKQHGAGIGTALAQIPTNQNLRDGVDRSDSSDFGSPVHHRVIGGSGSARYLLLLPTNDSSGFISGKLLGRWTFSGGFGLNGADVNLRIMSRSVGGGFSISFDTVQYSNNAPAPTLALVTVSGVDWIALDVNSTASGTPFGAACRFDGTAKSSSASQLTWVSEGSATVVQAPYNPTVNTFRYFSPGYSKFSATGKFGDVAGAANLSQTAGHVFQNNANSGTLYVINDNTGSSTRNVASFLATGAAGFHLQGNLNAITTVSIAANGNITNTNNSYGAISDLKLKTDITDVPSYWDKYKLVRWVNYLLANDPSGTDQKLLGVIAQEVESVFPGLIESTPDIVEVQIPAVLDEDGEEVEPARTESQENGEVTLSVKYSVLGHISDCVVQEAQARIESLEAQLLALAGRVEALEA